MKDFVIIGAGGHARVIADMLAKNAAVTGESIKISYLDDNLKTGELINGYPVIGKIEDCVNYPEAYFVIGIGDNAVRKSIAETYALNYKTVIHPTAVIADHVDIQEGTVVMANAVINTGTTVGRHCIINTGAVIEHDNNIGDFTHISPNATLCGTVQVGTNCHIGAGSTVINNLKISDDVVVGAGSTVIKDVLESGTYVGNPARKIFSEEKYGVYYFRCGWPG